MAAMMGQRILIVDDEESILSTVTRTLSAEGYVVKGAASAAEVPPMLRNGHFDVILLDVFMPGVNGLELLHTITGLAPRTSVLMVTGYASTEIADACMKGGAKGFLAKPFTKEELVTALERMVFRPISHTTTPRQQ